jgi:translation initiation factor 1 (eIF-1/SUI1)
MPFKIDGTWIPSNQSPKNNSKPVKVRLIKRANNLITIILNLNLTHQEQENLAKTLKKKFGCGGCVNREGVEIQGDKVVAVKEALIEMGIKAS